MPDLAFLILITLHTWPTFILVFFFIFLLWVKVQFESRVHDLGQLTSTFFLLLCLIFKSVIVNTVISIFFLAELLTFLLIASSV